MTLEELVQLVVATSDGYVSFPFNQVNKREKLVWHVVKHQHNDKIYGLVFEREGQLQLNVKLRPEHGEEMRQIKGVTPGFHMNKTHWNTIAVNATTLTNTELSGMIQESARLTTTGVKR